MNRSNQALIDSLTAELVPVRPHRSRAGYGLVAVALAATILLVALLAGLWGEALSGNGSPYFYLTNLMLLALGAAAATAAVRMASPSVGNRYDAPALGLAMLAILPAVALGTALAAGRIELMLGGATGMHCTIRGTAAALITAAALTAWLKRGAPVQPERAGLLAGVAAGALGSMAFGLSCPVDAFDHLAIWHVLPVVILGLAGRLILPRLIRW